MTLASAPKQDASLAAPPDLLLDAAASLSRAVLVLALLAGLTMPGVLQEAGPVLLALAALLGLPHGAVDHLAWSWASGRDAGPDLPVLAGYAAAATAAVVVALLVPLPALLVLLALSVAHFAEGEVGWHRLRGGVGGRPAGAAIGLAVVALPLTLRPEAVGPVLTGLHPTLPSVLLAPGVRLPLLTVTGAVVILAVWSSRRSAAGLGELALIVAVAAVLPPLAAFAAWFAGWHAVRHTARLIRLDPRSQADLAAHRLAAPVRRFASAAALPSVAALLGTLVLAGVLGLTGGLLVALLALTVPHTAVVARLGAVAPRRTPEPQPAAAGLSRGRERPARPAA